MRKFLSIANESRREPALVLSMEEEDQLIADSSRIVPEVMTELSEINGLIDRSDGLEDLAVIVDNLDEASPQEIALINNSAAMAVAGTDVTPEEILGQPAIVQNPDLPPEEVQVSMEEYVGTRVSAESIDAIRSVAASIWESIKAFLKRIWEKLVYFYDAIRVNFDKIRRGIETMRKELEAREDKQTKNTVSINSLTKFLVVSDRPISGGEDLNRQLATFEKALKGVYTDYPVTVKNIANQLSNKLKEFKVDKSEACLVDMNDVAKYINSSITGITSSGPKIDGFDCAYSDCLLGNVVLQHKQSNGKQKTPIGIAEQLHETTLTLVAHNTNYFPELAFDVKSSPKSVLSETLDKCEDILRIMEVYTKVDGFRSAQRAAENLREASEIAERVMVKIREQAHTDQAAGASNAVNEGNQIVIANYRRAINYNVSVAHWVSKPGMPMTNHVFDVMRATLYFVRTSLKELPLKEKNVAKTP